LGARKGGVSSRGVKGGQMRIKNGNPFTTEVGENEREKMGGSPWQGAEKRGIFGKNWVERGVVREPAGWVNVHDWRQGYSTDFQKKIKKL